jgi:organic radical activating enzyme
VNAADSAAALYPVHETFHSWQGEGGHLGKSAFFIRLYGCPVRCPWCDSADTWDTRRVAAPPSRLSVEALVKEAVAARPEIVVLTGGEPTIHDLAPLANALHAAGLPVHLETCGAFPLRGNFDWVAISPKDAAPPLLDNLICANELKLIIGHPDDLPRWSDFLAARSLSASTSVWLHPEWSRHADPVLLDAITRWVIARGAPFRAGWQIHKCYDADEVASRPSQA